MKVPPLTLENVPTLAKALLGNKLGWVRFIPSTASQNPSVRFFGRGIDLTIPKKDWEKVLPLLEESYWNLPPNVTLEFLGLSQNLLDADLSRNFVYTRVVADLSALFPTSYPTALLWQNQRQQHHRIKTKTS